MDAPLEMGHSLAKRREAESESVWPRSCCAAVVCHIIGWAGSGIGGCMPYKDWGIQINRSGNVSSEPMNRQSDCDTVYHPFISSMMGFQDSDVSKTFRQPKVTMGNLPNVKIITNSSNLKGSSNP
jgi:hypothetical protein